MRAKTRVILLRHGRSTLNDQGRYQGSSDNSELTAAG
ncbi:MAG: histidine phosphatase family protein, partial [Bacteroidota bacterium]